MMMMVVMMKEEEEKRGEEREANRGQTETYSRYLAAGGWQLAMCLVVFGWQLAGNWCTNRGDGGRGLCLTRGKLRRRGQVLYRPGMVSTEVSVN